jgi:iron complex outermembrane receptor protein
MVAGSLAAIPAFPLQARIENFSIPAQPLSTALVAFGQQSGRSVVYDIPNIAKFKSPGVNGQLDEVETLQRLLKGSGLKIVPVEGGYVIKTAVLAQHAAPLPQLASPPLNSAEQPDLGGKLEEIVVTAQKRSENIQRVPIAITALTAKALQTKGIQNAYDLNSVVPGLNIQRNVSSPLIYTRGIGLISATPGNENTTAIYVDGVYYLAPVSSIFSFSNIERIEALKGPQGTLFGRNAIGGLISITTRDPQHQTSGNINVGYGNFDTVTSSGYLTTGLSENVAADIAFYTSQQGKGWGHNLVTGSEVYSRDETSVRTRILFTPSDGWKITLAGDYSFAKDDVGIAKQPLRGTFVPGGGPNGSGAPASIWDVAEGIDSYGKIRNYGGSLRIEHSLPWADFVSVSAYRKSAIHSVFDQVAARTIQTILQLDPDGARWGTQELQLQSKASSKLKWIVGLYYLNANAYYDPLRQGATPTGPFTSVFSRQKTDSFAAYAQASYPIFENTNLTIGARETIDRRQATGFVQLLTGAHLNTTDLKHTWKDPTWRIALDQRLASSITGYVSYSRGFKSGVYNATALTPTLKPVNPEKLDAFEGGLKSQLLDSRLRLNLAGFYYNYRNQQLQLSLGNGVLQFLNAASSHMYGGEVEAAAKITDRLQLQGSVSYLHAKYSKFPAAPCTLPKTGGGNTLFPCNAAGNDMTRAPHATFNVSADYTVPVGGGSVTASANYYYNDGFYGDSGNTIRQPSYDLVNAQLAYKDPSGHWDAKLWARNLFSTAYYTFMAAGGPIGSTGAPGAPRTFGASIGYNF